MRLLLAEDEIELSNALVTVLKHNHFSVDAVYNGQDALDYLLTGNYDGAILDIMMPKRDGLSVLREARKAGLSLPILLLTAKSEIDDRVEGLDAGADDYLTKPFAMKELLARIRVMTRRKAKVLDSKLHFEDLSLDRNTFLLEGPLDSIRLSGKEYQMMEILISSPNQIFSTNHFLEKVWGFDTEIEQSIVWVNISYLRKKITVLGAHVQIKATRGLGYSLEVHND